MWTSIIITLTFLWTVKLGFDKISGTSQVFVETVIALTVKIY